MQATVPSILLAGLFSAVQVQAAPASYHAELTRTAYGVAHVRADDFLGLGFGFAHAYAQDNICMFADSLLTARGERSRFFGPTLQATAPAQGEYGVASQFLKVKNEDSDFFFKGYLDAAELNAGYAAASQEARDLLTGFVAGYNRYLADNAGTLPAACKDAPWVRPISVGDMHLVIAEKALHASGEIFAREFVNGGRAAGDAMAALSSSRLAPDADFVDNKLASIAAGQLGSNGLALGKDATSNGRGLLLGNPHYPWTGTDRFYQIHLTVPGKYDAMGASLGGLPMVAIGFNKDIAWTHTVTTARHFTMFRLTLDASDKSGTTYMVDGKPQKMSSKTVTVERLLAGGKLDSVTKTFFFSEHGAVIAKPEANLTWSAQYAYVLADPNRHNTRMVDQWLGIGAANSVQELKKSLESVVGLPWVNTLAADRHGNTLFADASVVPHVSPEKFKGDCMSNPQLLMLDGARSECAWGRDAGVPAGVFSPANGPWMMRTDYVGNSNDTYWTTNPHALLTGPAGQGYSPLYGRAGAEQSLRTRLGIKQLEQALVSKKTLDAKGVQDLMFSNRIYAAEMILPDLLQACFKQDDPTLDIPCKVLSAWDKRADLESRGYILFREFWFMAVRVPQRWAVPFDVADPIDTPRGLSEIATEKMLGLLKVAAAGLTRLGIPLDARTGDFQDHLRHGVRAPIHGGYGDREGAYNAIYVAGPLDSTGFHNVEMGTGYLQVVGFDDRGPVAQGMLVYGQSTDPKSAHYADQLPVYVRKQWPILPFTRAQIEADPQFKVTRLFN